jgi:hypothetical protein
MLASLLIHTTLNWLPVAEFSHYESAMALLCVLMFPFALLVLFGDSRFRLDPPGQGEGSRRPGS